MSPVFWLALGGMVLFGGVVFRLVIWPELRERPELRPPPEAVDERAAQLKRIH